MKFKLQIKEIDHDSLSCFLTDSTYGSHMFGFDCRNCPTNTNRKCFEDILADMLLNNEHIIIYDITGNDADIKNSKYNKEASEELQMPAYNITIKDIMAGIAKAFNTEYGCKIIPHFLFNDGELDLYDYNYLMQFVIFSEYRYT